MLIILLYDTIIAKSLFPCSESQAQVPCIEGLVDRPDLLYSRWRESGENTGPTLSAFDLSQDPPYLQGEHRFLGNEDVSNSQR